MQAQHCRAGGCRGGWLLEQRADSLSEGATWACAACGASVPSRALDGASGPQDTADGLKTAWNQAAATLRVKVGLGCGVWELSLAAQLHIQGDVAAGGCHAAGRGWGFSLAASIELQGNAAAGGRHAAGQGGGVLLRLDDKSKVIWQQAVPLLRPMNATNNLMDHVKVLKGSAFVCMRPADAISMLAFPCSELHLSAVSSRTGMQAHTSIKRPTEAPFGWLTF